jgi:hypothetical protein
MSIPALPVRRLRVTVRWSSQRGLLKEVAEWTERYRAIWEKGAAISYDRLEEVVTGLAAQS